MPRAYDVKTVAVALGVRFRWLDNLLSQHELPGITSSRRQGVGRVISEEGVLAVELVRLLSDFGLGVGRAASVARATLASRAPGALRFADESGIVLDFPLAIVERRLREQLLDAVDAVPRLARGRPRLAP